MTKKVTIEVTNLYSRVCGPLPYDVNFEISSLCSYMMEGAQFTANGKAGWDGTKKLYNPKTQSFYTGLLNRVVGVLRQRGYTIEFDDKRVKPSLGEEINVRNYEDDTDITLRPYQIDCVDALIKASRGCIQVSVSGGKTVVIAATVAKLNVNSLIIVPTSALLYQTRAELKKFLNVPIGIIGDDKVDIQNITVALFQACTESTTVLKNKLITDKKTGRQYWKKAKVTVMCAKESLMEYFASVDLVFTDEAHRCTCTSIQKIYDACENAYFRFACSGTILRGTEEDILTECITGRIIRDYRASELIKLGWVMRPTIHLLSYKQARWSTQYDSKGAAIKGVKEYQLLYSERITNNLERNKIITDIVSREVNKGKTVLVSIRFLEHGNILEKVLKKEFGEKVKFINGEIPTDEVQTAFRDLRAKNIQACIASSLVNEGVNIPSLEVLVFAGCPSSKVNVMQVIGRVLRKSDGKENADVYMLQDYGCKFLSDASKEREEILLTEPEFVIKRS